MLVVLLLAPEMHLTRKPFAVSKGKRILSTRGHGEVRDQVKYEEAAGGVLQCGLGSLAESFIPKERGHSVVGASLGSFTSLLLSTET